MNFLLGGEQILIRQSRRIGRYYDKKSQMLKFNSPFDGQLKVIVADKNLQSMDTFDVLKGPMEMDFPLGDIVAWGTLIIDTFRAIDENTEHLPQLAVGKFGLRIYQLIE